MPIGFDDREAVGKYRDKIYKARSRYAVLIALLNRPARAAIAPATDFPGLET